MEHRTYSRVRTVGSMAPMANSTTSRRVAILGGNRIPFARSDGAYANASNQDMFTAALSGLVDRFNLGGEKLGAVIGGAVLKHSRDFNLMRECVLGSALSLLHPGVRSAAGLRHRSAGDHRRRRRHRRRPLRGGRRGRGGHHLGRADRVRRRPAPHAARAAPVEVQRRPAQAGRQAARVAGRGDSGQQRAAHRAVDGRARRRSPPSRWASSASTRTSWPPPATATWPPPTTAASSTISSRRSSGCTATTTCGPIRRRRSWPSSSRCSA